MSDRVRWGIIGAGNIACHAIAPAIKWSRNGVLRAVASRDAERARVLGERLGAEAWHGSYEALLADPSVQAVYIGLPNGLHEEWTLKAAAAGKHVLCEKALALSTASALRMRAGCAQAGVLLMEAYMYRHHPQWETVRALLREGKIGLPRFFSAHLAGMLRKEGDHRWSSEIGGGALYDVTCYGINAARYLLGAEPVRVTAQGDLGTEFGVDLSSQVLLEFPGGVLAAVQGSLGSYPSQGLTITGTHGQIDLPRPFIPYWESVSIKLRRDAGDEEIRVPGANQFLHQVEYFARCVQKGEGIAFPGEDGVLNTAACEAAQRSWSTRSSVTVADLLKG